MYDYLTAAEFEREMNKLKEKYANDPKTMHIEMDNLMISILRSRGFDIGCDIFEETRKLYA